jgi:hypothetical protein
LYGLRCVEVEVLTDSVDPLAVCGEGVMEDVVTGAGDGEHVVVFVDTQLLDVDVRVFPGLKVNLEHVYNTLTCHR